MKSNNTYNPDIAIHPGETLQDILSTLNMPQKDLAKRTGLTPKTINEIIQGKNSISPETAIKLAGVFGMSATFWNNLERNYKETVTRLKADAELEKEQSYLQEFKCYTELAKWNYVSKTINKKEKIINLLNFFGVSSLRLVHKIQPIAFRKTKQQNISSESLAAWLRCGELDAQKINTQAFDKEKLVSSLEQLRRLTTKKEDFPQKQLVEICATFGVAVTFIPYFKNTHVNGATKWLNSDKAMIQLSLRGKYEDIFWFTFFHELAHLLKHGKKEQFVEFENMNGMELKNKEEEADKFARNTLIPKTKEI